jgi:hypothetical protein
MLMLTVQPLTRRVGCAVFAADRYPATRGEHAVRVFCSSGHENVVLRGLQREEGRRLAEPAKPYICVSGGGVGRCGVVWELRYTDSTAQRLMELRQSLTRDGRGGKATRSESDGTSLTVRSATTAVGR